MRRLMITLAVVSIFEFQASASELSLPSAQSIAAKAAAYAKSKKWQVSVAVVNSEGNLIYFQRGDGAYFGSIEASIQKAKSANAFQRPTSAFVDGVKQGRIGLLGIKDVVAIEGGVPITLKGAYSGAIGVSGAKSTEDEECAMAGIK